MFDDGRTARHVKRVVKNGIAEKYDVSFQSSLIRRTIKITQSRQAIVDCQNARLRDIGVSRVNSHLFRIQFVFSIVHRFPFVVTQYCSRAQSSSPPRRSGRVPLTHPAPHRHWFTLSRTKRNMYFGADTIHG